jgi:hypothetical protein
MNYKLVISLIFFSSCTKSTSTSSNTSSVTPPQVNVQIPATPTGLLSKLSSPTSVALTWNDQSTNELGFKIERKADGGNYILIATVGTNVTSYQDLNLSLNSSYTYRVYAYNSGGNSSGYSNTINIPGLRDGLIGYFPFNGNAIDESNNGNNGVVQGATEGTDRFGNINSDYIFNGTNSKVIINNKTLALNGMFSISCWIKINNLNPPRWDAPIVGLWNYEVANGTKFFLSYRKFNNDPGIAFYYNSSLNTSYKGVYSQNWNPFLSQWYNCVFIYSPGSNFTCYINGQLHFTSNNVPAKLYEPIINQLFIGAAQAETGNLFFNGEIDDIRFYNRILNMTEITYLSVN